MQTATKACLLAQIGDYSLVLSAPGFLLVFAGHSWPVIEKQLQHFDAGEWYLGIESIYRAELAGLDAETMADASALLDLVPAPLRTLLNNDLLDQAHGSPQMYNLLHSATPFHVKARLQALNVLPMLQWEFRQMSASTDRVRRRIDAGKSVWDAYLEIYPGRTAILRRIAASPVQPEGWRGKLAGLLEILDPLPPEKVPQSEADWNAFHSICLGIRLEGEEDDNRLWVKHRWLEECAKLGWSKSYQRLASMEGGADALTDCFDLLGELAHAGAWLISDGESAWEEYSTLWLRAPQQMGLFRILEASIRWHRNLWAAAGLPDSVAENGHTWPRLLPEPLALNGNVIAHSLGNAPALQDEGQHMRHCVGSYWLSCFLGESHIISLRDARGGRLSTLEIRIGTGKSRHCYIVQHRGKGNATPDAALRALEAKLCTHIQQHADFQNLQDWRKKAAELDEVLNLSGHFRRGFDLYRVEMLAAVLGRERLIGLFADDEQTRQRMSHLLPEIPRPAAPPEDIIEPLPGILSEAEIDALISGMTLLPLR